MREAKFIEELTVGAKRYWLLEPLGDFDYVIVAPEPMSHQTSVYAATDHGDVTALKDDSGNPLALARFDGELPPDEALARLGHQVTGSLPSGDAHVSGEDDTQAA